MTDYTTLFFDLDNTLLDFHASENRAVREVFKLHGLPHGDREATIYSAVNQEFWEAFEAGKIKREDIFVGRFRKTFEILELTADPERVAADYFERLAAGHDLMPDAVEILNYLRNRGYAICATTNGVVRTQYRRIDDSGLTPFFDGIFVSEEIGFQKPDQRYFEQIIAAIPEKDPTKILVIGDSLSSDIAGGINAGLDTCWLNPKGKTATLCPTYEIKSLAELKKIL